jgi:hypothetical protein
MWSRGQRGLWVWGFCGYCGACGVFGGEVGLVVEENLKRKRRKRCSDERTGFKRGLKRWILDTKVCRETISHS